MDTIILRKLTYKSTLWFGRNKGMTIQQIINLKHTRYLRWIYYNVASVTFIDEILNDIKICYDKFKIEKPGTNKELSEKLDNILFAHIAQDGKKGICLMSHVKKDLKMHNYRMNKCNRYSSTKLYL